MCWSVLWWTDRYQGPKSVTSVLGHFGPLSFWSLKRDRNDRGPKWPRTEVDVINAVVTASLCKFEGMRAAAGTVRVVFETSINGNKWEPSQLLWSGIGGHLALIIREEWSLGRHNNMQRTRLILPHSLSWGTDWPHMAKGTGSTFCSPSLCKFNLLTCNSNFYTQTPKQYRWWSTNLWQMAVQPESSHCFNKQQKQL